MGGPQLELYCGKCGTLRPQHLLDFIKKNSISSYPNPCYVYCKRKGCELTNQELKERINSVYRRYYNVKSRY